MSIPSIPRTAPWGRLHLSIIREDMDSTKDLLKVTDVNTPTRVRFLPLLLLPTFLCSPRFLLVLEVFRHEGQTKTKKKDG